MLSDLPSFSVSLMTMFNEGNWPSHLWPDLVVFGFLLALGSSLVDVAAKLGRRVAIVEALAFAMTAAGVLIAVTSGFADWPFGKAGTSGVTPSLGAWLCLMIAAVGAVLAVVQFVEPDAFTPRPHIPGVVAGTAGPLRFHASVPSAPPISAAPPLSADAPDVSAPGGNLQIVVNGQATWRAVGLGETLVVGSDPAAEIALADPWVSPRHTSIERAGPGWLVRGLDPANPTWILDATGRAHPIDGELGLRSGELVIGGAQVRLYPPT